MSTGRARRARNHKQKPVDDSVDDCQTPLALFEQLHGVHRFTVDAAASARNAQLPRYWTRESDGLSQSWEDERVWLNPPYSRIEPWLAKAWHELRAHCPLVVLLLPANRCEQPFWQQHIEPFRDGPTFHGVRVSTRFLPGRPRFGFPTPRPKKPKGERPPFGLVVVTMERAA